MRFDNTTLQSLGKVHGGVYYPPAVFEKSPEAWNGTKVVFGRTHPDLNLFARDPEAALKAINGRMVGTVENARVQDDLLKAIIDVDEDPEIVQLWNSKALGISTGMMAIVNPETKWIEGTPTPNHVLLFPLSAANQKDPNACVAIANAGGLASLTTVGEFDMTTGEWRGYQKLANSTLGMTVGEYDMVADAWRN